MLILLLVQSDLHSEIQSRQRRVVCLFLLLSCPTRATQSQTFDIYLHSSTQSITKSVFAQTCLVPTMGSQKRQKSALYRRPTQKKAVRDQRDEPRASSSISVKDQMEDKYEDSLSSSSLSDIDDDTLNSLGEEIGISDSPDEDSSTGTLY